MEEFVITPAESHVLEKIENKISEHNSLEETIDSIFPDFQKIIPCNRLGTSFIEEDGQRLVNRYIKTDYNLVQIAGGYAIDVQGSLFLPVLKSKKTVIYNLDKQIDEIEDKELLNLLKDEGIRTYIITPVISGNNIIGMLSCGSLSNIIYTKHQISLFEKIAKLLMYTLERTYHTDQIDKYYQSYNEMLSFVVHELKSPISSIITLARTLYEGYYGKIDEKQREIIQRVIKKAEYLDALSNEYLNLSRFESNTMELRPKLVDFIEDILEPSIELLLPQINERSIKFKRNYLQTVFPIVCDPDLIRIVIINLLNNGIKYGKKGGALRISIKKSYKKFRVSIWNEGPGFSETEKKHLFKKFSRLESKELIQQRGSGIGLYISWKIIQMHGGRIFAESVKGSWAEFTIEMAQHMDICIVD